MAGDMWGILFFIFASWEPLRHKNAQVSDLKKKNGGIPNPPYLGIEGGKRVAYFGSSYHPTDNALVYQVYKTLIDIVNNGLD